MATYFIGDVHGCYDELIALLKHIAFDRNKDKLIFVGDLINRGPKSLEVLRFVRDLGDCAQTVLGNHDFSFLAYAWGIYHGRNSDYPEMFAAEDAPELLNWLRQQPVLIHNEKENYVVVHAGIPPRWTLEQAKKQAKKAEKKLRGKKAESYLRYAYARHDDKWQSDYSKRDKFRYRVNGFSRMRYCNAGGEPDFGDKGPVGEQRAGLSPWFDVRRKMQDDGNMRIIFGHWAALGYYESDNAICVDSGCAWGGELTAILLTKQGVKRFCVSAKQRK